MLIWGLLMTVLELEQVVGGYVSEIDIINGVSMAIERSLITGMIGPNGAGKSTLLKMIFGFLHPRQGVICFEGRQIQTYSPYQIKKLGISFVPQGASTFPFLSIHEHFLLSAWTFRHDRRLLRKRINNVYQQFPTLKTKARTRATLLSGGQLRLLSVAKELVSAPRLLLIDEPSCGLAPNLVSQVYSLLRELKDKGITILLVDQNIQKAIECSDCMYQLEMGQIAMHGPTDYFRKNIRGIISESLLGSQE